MIIRNDNDLKLAYEMLMLAENVLKVDNSVKEKVGEVIKSYKKDIRSYYKHNRKRLNTSLVKDYGIDGYIEKIELPFMFSKDEANRYVESNIVMEYYTSQYDCTGQCFTSWYRIYKNSKNRYICYHRVSVDC